MTKGELMQRVYDLKELCNIDASIPLEYQKDPEIHNWCHVMNYNKPNDVFGKLENIFEVAEDRGIEIPGITSEEMTVISNIQLMEEKMYNHIPLLWSFRHLTIDQLRQKQDDIVKKWNKYLKS